jgi:hypothetical protein
VSAIRPARRATLPDRVSRVQPSPDPSDRSISRGTAAPTLYEEPLDSVTATGTGKQRADADGAEVDCDQRDDHDDRDDRDTDQQHQPAG